MKTGRHTYYENVLHIPEGQSGEFAIKHVIKPAGTPVLTSNMRSAYYRGQAQENVTFDHETRWHLLTEEGRVWMSDYPIEQIQHDEELHGFHGKVLVGGKPSREEAEATAVEFTRWYGIASDEMINQFILRGVTV